MKRPRTILLIAALLALSTLLPLALWRARAQNTDAPRPARDPNHRPAVRPGDLPGPPPAAPFPPEAGDDFGMPDDQGEPPPPGMEGFPPPRAGEAREMLRRRFQRRQPYGPPGQQVGPQRIITADNQLARHRAEFEAIETEREQLMESLAAKRADYERARLSAGSVLQRQEIDRLLGDLQRNAERDALNNEQAARLLKALIITSPHWRPLMTDTTTSNPAARQLPEGLRARWRAAGEAIAKQNPADYMRAMAGAAYGAVLLDFANQLPEGPTLAELMRPGQTPLATMQRLGDAVRNKLIGRLDRIEKRVNDLETEADKQRKEIVRLRQLLTHPEPAGPPPADAP